MGSSPDDDVNDDFSVRRFVEHVSERVLVGALLALFIHQKERTQRNSDTSTPAYSSTPQLSPFALEKKNRSVPFNFDKTCDTKISL